MPEPKTGHAHSAGPARAAPFLLPFLASFSALPFGVPFGYPLAIFGSPLASLWLLLRLLARFRLHFGSLLIPLCFILAWPFSVSLGL